VPIKKMMATTQNRNFFIGVLFVVFFSKGWFGCFLFENFF